MGYWNAWAETRHAGRPHHRPTMLAYFPEPFEDETVHSLAARYGRHLNLSATAANTDLFGGEDYCAAYDLPQRMTFLAARLPRGSRLTASRLIRRHTAFPFYRAIGSLADARALFSGMLTNRQTNRSWRDATHLGGNIPKQRWLRFCPECHGEMIVAAGECFWKREHQLPGVLVCPNHGCDLRESTVPANRGRMHLMPTAETCPDDAPSVLAAVADAPRRDLDDMAAAMVKILRSGRLVQTRQAEAVEAAKVDWMLKGLRRSKGVDRGAMRNAVAKRFGYLEPLWPKLFGIRATGSDPWTDHAFPRVAIRFSPIHNHMVMKAAESAPYRRPWFGPGPWRCENPLAEHQGREVVERGFVYLGGNKTRARFICACGCIYSKSKDHTGRETQPYLLEHGPLLRDYIRRAIAQGTSRNRMMAETKAGGPRLKAVADELGLQWPFPEPAQALRGRKPPSERTALKGTQGYEMIASRGAPPNPGGEGR